MILMAGMRNGLKGIKNKTRETITRQAGTGAGRAAGHAWSLDTVFRSQITAPDKDVNS